MKENLFRVYRRGDEPATSMDWAIRLTDSGVEVRAGPTDRPAPLTEVPAQSCPGGDPQREMDKRIAQKIEDGYRPMGQGSYPGGRLAITRPEPQVGDELYWEVAKPLPQKRLRKVLTQLGEDLHALNGQAALVTENDGKNVIGVLVPTPGGEWAFGQNSHGGLHADGRGGGVVSRAQGRVPVLALMRMAREFPGSVAFADGRAEAVTLQLRADDPWVGRAAGPIEETQALATALGLCPAAQVVVSKLEEDRPIFF